MDSTRADFRAFGIVRQKKTFYINGNFENTLLDENMVQVINHTLDINEDYEFIITIKSDQYPALATRPDDESNADMMTRISEELHTNYENVFESCQVDGDDDTLESRLISKYVLFDDADTFEVIITGVDEVATTLLYPSGTTRTWDNSTPGTYIVISHAVTMKVIRRSTIYNTNNIILKMLAASNARNTADLLIVQNAWVFGDLPTTNDFFYKGCLRASLFSTSMLKTADCNSLISEVLDSGYKKKKVKWWKKLLLIIIMVIIVIVACAYTGPQGCTAAMSLADAAFVATVVAVSMAGLSMAMQAWGDDTGAGFAAKMSSVASKISAVLGIASIISNIMSSITQESLRQEAIKEISQEALAEMGTELAESTIQETMKVMTGRMTISGAYEAAKKLVTNMISKTTEISLQNFFKIVDIGSGIYRKNEQKAYDKKVSSVQAEIDELKGEEDLTEAQRISNILNDMDQLRVAPINSDQSKYNIDKFCEPVKGTYTQGKFVLGHLGTVGKTVKTPIKVDTSMIKFS